MEMSEFAKSNRSNEKSIVNAILNKSANKAEIDASPKVPELEKSSEKPIARRPLIKKPSMADSIGWVYEVKKKSS